MWSTIWIASLSLSEPGNRTLQDEIIYLATVGRPPDSSPANDRLTEIGAVKMRGMQVVDTFGIMVNPEHAKSRRTSWS